MINMKIELKRVDRDGEFLGINVYIDDTRLQMFQIAGIETDATMDDINYAIDRFRVLVPRYVDLLKGVKKLIEKDEELQNYWKNLSKKDECEHDWVRSNWVYTTEPPCWDEICKKCGEMRCVSSQPSVNEFEETLKKFNKHEYTAHVKNESTQADIYYNVMFCPHCGATTNIHNVVNTVNDIPVGVQYAYCTHCGGMIK
jgi:hypothetical protein